MSRLGCDGQVLVTHDLLGLFDRFTPKFVKRYADLHGEMCRAFQAFRGEVEARTFPGDEHSVEMPDDKWRRFLEEVDGIEVNLPNKLPVSTGGK